MIETERGRGQFEDISATDDMLKYVNYNMPMPNCGRNLSAPAESRRARARLDGAASPSPTPASGGKKKPNDDPSSAATGCPAARARERRIFQLQ